ncbi:hypothetical protein AnigIFM60653_005409 [Aspergillus niger]|nr:hypothetical protein AnigIFM60653_005409 [Aspergillus niger]GLA12996.1 hypothetical protein AnigIFM62618_009512 [Aspergillus niger]
MGWEMLQYTLRVVDHIQEKGFTNSGAIKQLFIDNWLSLFEMTSNVRENPSTDEDFRGTPEGTPVEGKKKQSTLIEGADVHADEKVAEDQRQHQNAYLAGRTGRGDHCSVA